MKKIMLLIFTVFTLISCGTNTLEPEKLQLNELQKYKDILTADELELLSVSKPRLTVTVTSSVQNDVYKIAGYQTGLTPTVGGTANSHVAYNAYAAKGSEIFTAPVAATTITIDADGNVDNVPLGTPTGNPQIGGKYKIWILEVYRPAHE